MASNPYVNKVEAFGDVLLDLTSDTVTANTLVEGITAHDASGALITGVHPKNPLDPIAYDYEMGYTDRGSWIYQDSHNNHTDVYVVKANHQYLLKLGGTVGTRFRSALLPSNPVGSLVNITGTQIINTNNPAAYAQATFKSTIDGWICVTKDNAGTTGLLSYLFDVTVV